MHYFFFPKAQALILKLVRTTAVTHATMLMRKRSDEGEEARRINACTGITKGKQKPNRRERESVKSSFFKAPPLADRPKQHGTLGRYHAGASLLGGILIGVIGVVTGGDRLFFFFPAKASA